jgi:hypothetical protein
MAQRTIKVFGEVEDGAWYAPDRQRILEVLSNLEGSIYELGGTFTVSSVRREVEGGEFVTLGVVITHDTFSPAERAKPTPVEEPAPDAVEPE